MACRRSRRFFSSLSSRSARLSISSLVKTWVSSRSSSLRSSGEKTSLRISWLMPPRSSFMSVLAASSARAASAAAASAACSSLIASKTEVCSAFAAAAGSGASSAGSSSAAGAGSAGVSGRTSSPGASAAGKVSADSGREISPVLPDAGTDQPKAARAASSASWLMRVSLSAAASETGTALSAGDAVMASSAGALPSFFSFKRFPSPESRSLISVVTLSLCNT